MRLGIKWGLFRLNHCRGDGGITMELALYAESAEHALYEDILPFWFKHSLDRQRGGFYGKILNNGKIDLLAPKGLVLCARILWTFSKAFHISHDNDYLCVAKHAFTYLKDFSHSCMLKEFN